MPRLSEVVIANDCDILSGDNPFTPGQQVHAVLHCELLLALFLEKQGITKGIIGVSKACCLGCAIGLEDMNNFGSQRRVSGTHVKLYAGLLPRESVLAHHNRGKMYALLRDELNKLCRYSVWALRQEMKVLEEELEEIFYI